MGDGEAARTADGGLALVLPGGGARAAYQVGLLRCIARNLPQAELPIITGVSAGAINATFLAARKGSLAQAVEELTEIWWGLNPEQVFRVGGMSLAGNLARWGARLLSGGLPATPPPRSLVDTAPLRQLLRRGLGAVDGEVRGIEHNLEHGRLRAFALSALRYSTGQTVTWVQGGDISSWERPGRVGFKARISVEHVMASCALPLLFPAVRVGNAWHGDGGIRMVAPLGPAIHLGADRILAVATRYDRSREEADRPVVEGYPPLAQVAGALLNAIFLDAIDHDALRLERVNQLLDGRARSGGLRPIRLVVLRPSEDLGRLAARYEPRLPPAFRFLTRGLGTRETESPDFLSLLMFQEDYIRRLIELGESDAEARRDEIQQLMLD